MDNYVNFRGKDIADRQMDTFIGLCKGLTADGKINKCEAYVLMSWLVHNAFMEKGGVFKDLFKQVSDLLNNGEPTTEKLCDLYLVLEKFAGDSYEVGELAKPTSLPIKNPEPEVVFRNSTFVFTGKFAFGTRQQCIEAVERNLGRVETGITKRADYLVIGSYVTESWKHETFGRKIEKALSMPNIKVITEAHFVKSLGM